MSIQLLPSSGSEIKSPERLQDLDAATAATSCLAVFGGAQIIRVHNVRATKVACDILKAIRPADNLRWIIDD
jgi:dihydropteroate synthase